MDMDIVADVDNNCFFSSFFKLLNFSMKISQIELERADNSGKRFLFGFNMKVI